MNKIRVLRGTIRDHEAKVRREDLSHQPTDTLLPEEVQRGDEPPMVGGAMAGG